MFEIYISCGHRKLFPKASRKPAGGRSLLHAECYLAGSGTTSITQHPWTQHLGAKFVYDHWRSADTGPFLYLFVHDLVTLIHFITFCLSMAWVTELRQQLS